MKKSLLILSEGLKVHYNALGNYFFKVSCTNVEGTISSLKV